jgi:hypothetical protein
MINISGPGKKTVRGPAVEKNSNKPENLPQLLQYAKPSVETGLGLPNAAI